MADHIHATVGVPGDPDPTKILGDFKRYGSRALNRRCGPPASDTWWAEGGSKRKLSDEDSLLCSIQYILDQDNPLLIWTALVPELDLPGGLVRRAGGC